MEKPTAPAESSDVFHDKKHQRRGEKEAVGKAGKPKVDKLSKVSMDKKSEPKSMRAQQPRCTPGEEARWPKYAQWPNQYAQGAAGTIEEPPSSQGQGTVVASQNASPQRGDGSGTDVAIPATIMDPDMYFEEGSIEAGDDWWRGFQSQEDLVKIAEAERCAKRE